MTIKHIRNFEKEFWKKKSRNVSCRGILKFISREKTFNNWAPRSLSKKVIAKRVELSKLKKGR